MNNKIFYNYNSIFIWLSTCKKNVFYKLESKSYLIKISSSMDP